MSLWRRFQRGHASFSLGFVPSVQRFRGMVLIVTAGLAAVMLLMFVQHLRAKDSAVGQGSYLDRWLSVVFNQVGETGISSLIDQATKVVSQKDAQELQRALSVAGLRAQPLSEPVVENLRPKMGQAEARLIAIYRLISEGRHREALLQADALVNDHPNFQLAHLVHGDLLSLQMRPVSRLGDVPDTKIRAASGQLNVLREESRRRLQALTERPLEGYVPAQFLSLATQSRHAIAIDASRSRLYLFENRTTPTLTGSKLAVPPRLVLVGDYYISVGLQGIEKHLEGDKRTPLGVYYITSSLDPNSLPDLYGVGALPINYPNPLDIQRGKTGSGIWLHGTPSDQFVRAPLASDGCVVLANPDLEHLLKTVQVRTTPVVIATELYWVRPEALDTERQDFEATLQSWRDAKAQNDLSLLRTFYSDRFRQQGRDLATWWPTVEREVQKMHGNGIQGLQLKDLSLLRWQDSQDTMVVTFGEVARGQSRGVTKRQYWARENNQWKIFFEGTP